MCCNNVAIRKEGVEPALSLCGGSHEESLQHATPMTQRAETCEGRHCVSDLGKITTSASRVCQLATCARVRALCQSRRTLKAARSWQPIMMHRCLNRSQEKLAGKVSKLKDTEAALHRTMQCLKASNLQKRQQIESLEKEKLKVAQLTSMIRDRDNKLKNAWIELDHHASNDGKMYKALSAVLTGMHRDLASSTKRMECSLTAALKAEDRREVEMKDVVGNEDGATVLMAHVSKAVHKSLAQMKTEQSSALKRMLLGVFTSIPCFKQVLKAALPHAEGVMRAALKEEQHTDCISS
ncbi:hypothetical protein CEUSTIGMA_g11476.t1 [Chlamydomonas eustigma]|uniref:Uncharacterized protein n=1 Tax=Chlamydomonas eustigma TaxID=1157962 RepID=A0A250XMC7_9CHLO|nr:hypothetical protein CEUSTIGMA_g11476.t1 [Chlamydomonas eustigma]|eukprot:GAX84052.1 hypothetical protein CEUSTIGMA_g11476.t1 [Chlamydomonas eustigma]